MRFVQLREEESGDDLIAVYNFLTQGSRERDADIFSLVSSDRT